MRTNRKKINDYPALSETPFIKLDSLEYRKFTTQNKAKEVVDSDTGEIASLVYSGKTIYGYKDTNPYSKLFKSGTLQLSKLSTSGVRVFCYLLMHIGPNKESIYLNAKEMYKFIGYENQKNVYEGIENLLEHNIIARKTGTSNYWINPNMVFNGDRTKLLDNPSREEYVNELYSNAKEVNQEYQIGKQD